MSEFVRQLRESTASLEVAMRKAATEKEYFLAAKVMADLAEREAAAFAEEHKLLDGKNPEVRKAQMAKVLAESADFVEAEEAMQAAEADCRGADLELEIARIRYATAKELVRWEAAMAASTLREMEY